MVRSAYWCYFYRGGDRDNRVDDTAFKRLATLAEVNTYEK